MTQHYTSIDLSILVMADAVVLAAQLFRLLPVGCLQLSPEYFALFSGLLLPSSASRKVQISKSARLLHQ